MSTNFNDCPHKRTADWICSVLVREVNNAMTLSDKEEAAMAIVTTRQYVKPMIEEWNHLNGSVCVKSPNINHPD